MGAVSINVRNPATGRSYVTSTDTEGYYRIPEIPPGEYEVLAENAGYQSIKHAPVLVSVNRVSNEDFVLKLAAEAVTIEVRASTSPMTDPTGPTLAASFPEREVREIPILTRDINNLGLLAPGILSVRTFSFGSTLVPFSSNGSRGRDNNFIIDSVDNNEPLFGGAATQFTNTDIFAEYTILTNQQKAEFGRNSGATVNAITKSGSNRFGGSVFWFGQHDALDARSRVEKAAQLSSPARYFENQIGATLGGPIAKDKTFYFISYQWDRTRNNLSNIFPVVATYPTAAGLTALRGGPQSPALLTLLNTPSMGVIPPLTAPCFSALPNPPATGYNLTNPCFDPKVPNPGFTDPTVGATSVPFRTFLVPDGNAYDVRDHQWSARVDHKLSNASDLYGRYLFDELRTPRFPLSNAGDSAFSDLGLYPDYRLLVRQRSQSLLVDHRYYWQRALNEFRFSFSRISSGTGAFQMPETVRNTQAAATVTDNFGGFGVFQPLFNSAGSNFTVGRDSGPTQLDSNVFQFQENFSYNRGNHSMKFGVNIVRIQSNILSNPSNLGQYFFGQAGIPGLSRFVSEPGLGTTNALFVFQRLINLTSDPNTGLISGQGAPKLRLREFDHFYFWQDDWRATPQLTISFGVRYENFGQPINSIADQNRRVSKVSHDQNNVAPRFGFAWAPLSHTVFRGGYAMMFNPVVLNIPLLIWQSGPVSPFFVAANPALAFTVLTPSGTYPTQPFDPAKLNVSVAGCSTPQQRAVAGTTPLINCSAQDTVDTKLVNPYVHNFSIGVQQGLGNNLLFEVGYVGSKGTKLFQHTDENAYGGWNTACTAVFGPSTLCIGNRRLPGNARGAITKVGNGGSSVYHSLQASLSRRLTSVGALGSLAFSAAYTWSHNIDNASEIFGPGARIVSTDLLTSFLLLRSQGFESAEAISPYAQDPNNLHAERANSSFDRRHRLVSSYVWELGRSRNWVLGGWQLGGVITWQTGQYFTPLNGGPFSSCADPGGFGRLSTARPAVGNPSAPARSIAVLKDPNCTNTALGYADETGATINPSTARFVQVPLGVKPGQTIPGTSLVAGSAGRNILLGPGIVNWDFALLKNFRWGENRIIQFRWEVYDLFNHRNPGYPIGNVFSADAQPSPAFAFSPRRTPSGVTGVIPENTIDAKDPITGASTFLSQQYMNTSSRRMQFALKFIF